jgi:hypothetical protein
LKYNRLAEEEGRRGRRAYEILVRKAFGKRMLGRQRIWKDNIEMNLRKIGS